MKIEGFVDSRGHCFFRTIFICGQLEEPTTILLMLDTGATTSTILDGDCERLGLNCKELSKTDEPTRIVGAEIYPHVLPDVAFVFIDNKRKLRGIRLESVEVIEQTEDSPRPFFSLMGLDIVKQFNKMTYEPRKGKITLER